MEHGQSSSDLPPPPGVGSVRPLQLQESGDLHPPPRPFFQPPPPPIFPLPAGYYQLRNPPPNWYPQQQQPFYYPPWPAAPPVESFLHPQPQYPIAPIIPTPDIRPPEPAQQQGPINPQPTNHHLPVRPAYGLPSPSGPTHGQIGVTVPLGSSEQPLPVLAVSALGTVGLRPSAPLQITEGNPFNDAQTPPAIQPSSSPLTTTSLPATTHATTRVYPPPDLQTSQTLDAARLNEVEASPQLAGGEGTRSYSRSEKGTGMNLLRSQNRSFPDISKMEIFSGQNFERWKDKVFSLLDFHGVAWALSNDRPSLT